jgi:hypothetical protein
VVLVELTGSPTNRKEPIMATLTKGQESILRHLDGFVSDGTDNGLYDFLRTEDKESVTGKLAARLMSAFWDVKYDEKTYVEHLTALAGAAANEVGKIEMGNGSSDWFSTHARNAAEYRVKLEADTKTFCLLALLFNEATA